MYVLDMVRPRGVLLPGKWMLHITANEAGTFETFMLAVGGLRMASSSVIVKCLEKLKCKCKGFHHKGAALETSSNFHIKNQTISY